VFDRGERHWVPFLKIRERRPERLDRPLVEEPVPAGVVAYEPVAAPFAGRVILGE